MKRVCMIVPSFSAKGGITAVVNGYCGSTLEEQFDVKYVETYCDGAVIKKLCKALTAYLRFLYLLIVWQPELIHIHSAFGGSFYRKTPFILIAKAWGIPIINHIHSSYLDSFYSSAHKFQKTFISWIYERCSVIIALSEEWKQDLSKMIDARKIRVVENYGILKPDVVKNRTHNETSNILFLGFISEKKGALDIPRVAEQVLRILPEVQFVIAGSGEQERVESRLSSDTLAHISFPGWVRGREKELLLKEADIFFLPSYYEGMPMSILEAMGNGLPVVSTRVGGIPRLIKDGVNGLLLEPGDTTGMAEAIISIFSDRAKQRDMGLEGAIILEREFSLTKHISKLSKIYEEV